MVGFILIVWGLLFAGIPVYSYLELQSGGSDSSFPLSVVVIFFVIGVIAILLGIYYIYCYFRTRVIAKFGTKTMGTFLDMQESGSAKNGNKLYFIRYFFCDENNVRHEQKSPARFKFAQAYFFKDLYHFNIRYSGKHAVITEPLDFEEIEKLPQDEQSLYASFNSPKSKEQSEQKTKSLKTTKKVPTMLSAGKNGEPIEKVTTSTTNGQKQYFVCDYCGYVQDEPGRCLSCGARIRLKK
jgi:hypothetical protein